jgi:hypothetical protein
VIRGALDAPAAAVRLVSLSPAHRTRYAAGLKRIRDEHADAKDLNQIPHAKRARVAFDASAEPAVLHVDRNALHALYASIATAMKARNPSARKAWKEPDDVGAVGHIAARMAWTLDKLTNGGRPQYQIHDPFACCPLSGASLHGYVWDASKEHSRSTTETVTCARYGFTPGASASRADSDAKSL